ncbi:MAG: flagellar protein FlaG [Magnetococcales bacterium]|nr:flagellar protein FlaG [Magnetococcales bacterium]
MTDRQDEEEVEEKAADKKNPKSRRRNTRKSALKNLAEDAIHSLTDFNGLRFGIDRKNQLIAINGLDNGNHTVIRLVSRESMLELMKEMNELEGMIYNHLN